MNRIKLLPSISNVPPFVHLSADSDTPGGRGDAREEKCGSI